MELMATYLKQSFLRKVEKDVKMGNISYSRMCEIIQDEVISNYTKTRYDTKEEFLKTIKDKDK
jgi:hypothetical protein